MKPVSPLFRPSLPQEEIDRLKAKNNPKNEPTGHFTGRCRFCGSKDLWDDNGAYGCNACGAFLHV